MYQVETGDTGFDLYEHPTCPHVRNTDGYLVSVLAVLVFAVANYLVQVIGPPRNVDGDVWRWRNTVISWVHSLLSGAGCLYCLYFKPELFKDPAVYCDSFSYLLSTFSRGYFVYDLADFVINNRALGNVFTTIHHFAVIGSFTYHLHYRVIVSFTTFVLTVEVNSIFLHARKLMQFHKWPLDNWFYKVIVILNLITFIRYRVYSLYFISASLPLYWYVLSVRYMTFITVSVILMDVMHVVLFWRLVKNDVFRNFKSSRLKQT